MKSQDGKNRSGYKRLVIAAAVCALVLAALLALNSIDFDSIDVTKLFGGRKNDEAETEEIFLCEPNYDIDITYDTVYMNRDRYITYSEGGVSTIISEYSNEFGAAGEFFLRYFSCLTSGDAEGYNSLFLDEYFDGEDTVPYERFTMQRVYDITVEKLSESLIEDGDYEGCTRTVYKVGYKIMHNDGTFRDDMPSDTVVPRLLETISGGLNVKISAIAKITYN